MGKLMASLVVVPVLILCYGSQVRSDASDYRHKARRQVLLDANKDYRYKVGDPVPLYANKLGLFHNLIDIDGHFDLPFCSPGHVIEKKEEALGEVLNEDHFVSAPYKLEFLVDKDSEVVCRKKLSKEEVALFRDAVTKSYYFMMYCDEVPFPIFWSIGKVDKEGKIEPRDYKYYLYKHIQFHTTYIKDYVARISACADPDALVDITDEKEVEVEFTYSVNWNESGSLYPEDFMPMRWCGKCEKPLKLLLRDLQLGNNTSQQLGITNKSNNDSFKTVFFQPD